MWEKSSGAKKYLNIDSARNLRTPSVNRGLIEREPSRLREPSATKLRELSSRSVARRPSYQSLTRDEESHLTIVGKPPDRLLNPTGLASEQIRQKLLVPPVQNNNRLNRFDNRNLG